MPWMGFGALGRQSRRDWDLEGPVCIPIAVMSPLPSIGTRVSHMQRYSRPARGGVERCGQIWEGVPPPEFSSMQDQTLVTRAESHQVTFPYSDGATCPPPSDATPQTDQTQRSRRLLRVRERRGREFESTSKIMQSEFSSTRDMGEGKGRREPSYGFSRMAAANCDWLGLFVNVCTHVTDGFWDRWGCEVLDVYNLLIAYPHVLQICSLRNCQ